MIASDAPPLAVVCVHYRTPELLLRCIRSVRRELDSTGMQAEVVVVDNSLAESGSAPPGLAALGASLIDPGGNLGYAAGANLGFARTGAPRVLLLNPDVELAEGCLQALLSALDEGYAVVGPRLYWDRPGRWMLPPTEEVSAGWALARLLAERGWQEGGKLRRRWRRHVWPLWQATKPTETTALSGAVLLARRDAWERSGGLDEGFRLYFEEVDWLLRLRRLGATAAYVPAAAARHDFNRSARSQEQARRWFATSQRRFRRRHLGRAFDAGARGLDRLLRQRPSAPQLAAWRRGEPLQGGATGSPDGGWQVEISPQPLGVPAAGGRLGPGATRDELPLRAARASGISQLYVTVLGEERELFRRLVDLDAENG